MPMQTISCSCSGPRRLDRAFVKSSCRSQRPPAAMSGVSAFTAAPASTKLRTSAITVPVTPLACAAAAAVGCTSAATKSTMPLALG
jgi:hypothetical protein